MAKKQQKLNIWVILGIIAFVFLLGKGGFLGSVITTCENIEPKSLTDYSNYVLTNNATFTTSQLNIATNIFDVYNAPLLWSGKLDAIDPGVALSCSQLLQVISDNTNGTFIILDKRQTLLNNDGYYWCNYENTLAFKSSELTIRSNYFATFEKCTAQEVVVPEFKYVANQFECEDVNGIWLNETCNCKNGTRVMIGMLCEPIPSSNVKTSSQQTTANQPYVPTTNNNKQTTSPQDYTMYYIVAGVLVVLFILYWFFERGPKKGLFKSI